MNREGYSQRKIARALRRSPAAISRELARNTGRHGAMASGVSICGARVGGAAAVMGSTTIVAASLTGSPLPNARRWQVVAWRVRVGGWEADTMYGFLRPRGTADLDRTAHSPDLECYMITFDNGRGGLCPPASSRGARL